MSKTIQKIRLKWGTVENLREKIEQYFETDELPNVAGLCIYLDIHRDTWHYYVSGTWRRNRIDDDERLAEIEQEQTVAVEHDIGDMDISGYERASRIDGIWDNACEPSVKAQVSDCFKKAAARIDDSNFRRMQTAKNPAGAIFYAKSALGYREKDQETSNNQQQIGAINVLIQLAPPQEQQSKTLKAAEVKVLED